MKQCIIYFFIFLAVNGLSQNCFETKAINFAKLDVRQIKSILATASIKGDDFACYRDTSENSDTVRIAYKTKSNNWISFATPFKEPKPAIDLIDIDNDGKPELIAVGTITKEIWPRGESSNGAILIYQIENSPTQILNYCNSCNVTNLGGQYQDSPVDFSTKWELKISRGNIIIQKPLGKKLSKADKETYKKFCRLSQIKPGTYKLVSGKFIKQ